MNAGPRTVNALLDHAARQHGHRLAVVDGATRLTFAQLRRRVAALAAGLARSGVGPHDRVAFLLGVGVDWVTLFYALMRVGAVAVPLNLTWTAGEIEQGTQLTDATVLVATRDFRGLDYVELVRQRLAVVDAVGDSSPGAVFTDTAPHLRRLLSDAPDEPASLAALAAGGADWTVREWDDLTARIGPDDDAIYLLTSGTTSFPKPVRQAHGSVLAGIEHFAEGLEACPDDAMLIIAPNYHVGAYLALLTPHLRGAPTHLVSHFVARRALEIVETERIGLLFGFDVHFLMLARDPQFPLFDFGSVRKTMIGSTPASFDEIEAMGVPHQGNIYGSSEYMAAQSFLPWAHRHDRERMRSTHGRPDARTEVRIIDPATGAVLPPGCQGEICVRGPALFRGYYNMPAETAAAFDADGFFRSGDLGRVDADGWLYYQGRLKETVKTGGENVSMQEVEQFLQLETPGVRRALVVATPHPRWGEQVVAIVEPEPGIELDVDGVRESCRGRLAGYKIPKQVWFVADGDWAITPTGKFDRAAMTARAIAWQQRGTATAASTDS